MVVVEWESGCKSIILCPAFLSFVLTHVITIISLLTRSLGKHENEKGKKEKEK